MDHLSSQQWKRKKKVENCCFHTLVSVKKYAFVRRKEKKIRTGRKRVTQSGNALSFP